MRQVLRAAIGLAGVLGILVAVRLWLAPGEVAGQLGLSPTGPLGLATLRADMGGFFAAGGVLALIAAVRGRGDLLVAPLLLIGLALAGRVFTVVASGYSSDMVPPIAIEAVLVMLLAAGWRVLDR